MCLYHKIYTLLVGISGEGDRDIEVQKFICNTECCKLMKIFL
jgi:hypothetical protein